MTDFSNKKKIHPSFLLPSHNWKQLLILNANNSSLLKLLKYWNTSFRPQTPVCFSWGCLTANCGRGVKTRKTEISFSMRKQTRMFWILYHKTDPCGSEYGRQIFGCVNPQHYKIKLSGKKTVFLTLKNGKGYFSFFPPS